jgi:hypothetical protein
MEGHANEITQSLSTSSKTLGYFTKQEISLATSLCASSYRGVGMEQRGISIM